MPTELRADYLIVGSGAVGMAFADTLLAETDATVVIVDRFAKPGGHWNVAYPFVTLHQPSAFYGVSSRELSNGRVDEVGLNKGLGDLATGADVSAYFDDVMRHQLLPTGRVEYFPMCDYTGDGAFSHTLTGAEYHVTYAKLVDATFLKTTVPSTHTPGFTIAPEAQFMALNDLPKITTPPSRFVVIGGGKTGIDACLWLLEHRVDPDRITWVVSRDAWLLDRRNTQPAEAFFADTIGAQAAQFEAIAGATSVDDLFDRLEDAGYFLRLDTDVRPSMFHGATISKLELAELRRISDVVRLGRVQAVEADRIVLDEGEIPTSPDALHIDCSASALTAREPKPIFDGELITPQTVSSYQPVFSAAFIAHVEHAYEDEEEKNQLCGVVPLPDREIDFLRLTAAFMVNRYVWSQNAELKAWLLTNRLDGFTRLVENVSPDDHDKRAILKRLRGSAMPAMTRLQELIAASTETAAAHG